MTGPSTKTPPAAPRGVPPSSAPEYSFGDRSARTATLDEERREVFDSVFQSMRIQEPDADHAAACAYLLRHLAHTEGRY
jgi:hypothetical protein